MRNNLNRDISSTQNLKSFLFIIILNFNWFSWDTRELIFVADEIFLFILHFERYLFIMFIDAGEEWEWIDGKCWCFIFNYWNEFILAFFFDLFILFLFLSTIFNHSRIYILVDSMTNALIYKWLKIIYFSAFLIIIVYIYYNKIY